jgi:hypothetical protein
MAQSTLTNKATKGIPAPKRKSTIATAWRSKYPGQYDDLSDDDIESAVTAKYPGQYDDLIEQDKADFAKPPPSVASRGLEMATGFANQLKDNPLTNPIKAAKTIALPFHSIRDMAGDIKGQSTELAESAIKSGHPTAYTAKRLAETAGVPISNIQEDWDRKSLGALGLDVGLGALSLYGMKSFLSKPKAKVPPKPTIVPNVDVPKYPGPFEHGQSLPQLTEYAGVDPYTPTGELEIKRRNEIKRNAQPKLLGPGRPVGVSPSTERFISHPSGAVADAFDINTPEWLRSLDQYSEVPPKPPIVTPEVVEPRQGPFGAGRRTAPPEPIRVKQSPFEPIDPAKETLPPIDSLPKDFDGGFMGADFGITAAADKIRKALKGNEEIGAAAAGRGGEIRRPGFTEPVKTPGAVELPNKVTEPWDFDKPGVRQPPEPYSQPRSQGITSDKGNPYSLQAEGDRTVPVHLSADGKVRMAKSGNFLKVKGENPVYISQDLAELIKRKKVSRQLTQGDYLADQTLASVPDRLRPEVPNVSRLRTLAEGAGKSTDLPPVEPIEGLSGPRENWGGPAKTVELGEGLKGKVRNPKLDYSEPTLPSAPIKGPIAERFEPVRGTRFGSPTIEPPPVVEPPAPTKPPPNVSGVKDVIGRGQKSYKQILKDIEESKKKVAAEEIDPVGKTIKPGTKHVLNTPTAAEVASLKAEGWEVKSTNAAGDVTLEYKGVEPTEVHGKLGWRNNRKFMDQNPKLKSIMEKLIGTRNAGDLIAKGIRDNFKHLSSRTKEQIVQFQDEMARGLHPDVSKFYDDMFDELRKNGIELDRKENYLTQMWDNTPAEIAKAYGGQRQINANASFQFRSVYQNYAEGIKAGLKPKMSPIELMQWYGKRANKLIADVRALRELKKEGYVSQASSAGPGMVPVGGESGSFKGWYAHPEVKGALETYLDKTPDRFLTPLKKVVGKAKGLALSSGLIPNKPLLTAHGMSMGSPFQGRAWQEGGFSRMKQAIKYGWNPESAAQLLTDENPQIIEATKKHKYNPNVENPEGTGPKFFESEEGRFGKVKKGINKVTELQHKFWEGPMFEKMLPALKWEAWKDNFAKFKKAGMSEAEAGAKATEITDHFYGGPNIDLLFNNKTFQSISSLALLAPDWLRTTVKLGVNIPKSLANELRGKGTPQSRVYMKAGGRILGIYTAANLMQKAMTGKYMVENEPSEMFNLYFDPDHTKGVKLFGTAADMFKYPVQMAKAAGSEGEKFSKGAGEMFSEFAGNRLSPLGRVGTEILTGEDYKGEKNLFDTTTRYGNYIPARTRAANTLAQTINLGPPQIAGPYNVATGRSSIPEAVIKVSEMPFIYRKKKNPFEFIPKP